jgi:hypothetical protein
LRDQRRSYGRGLRFKGRCGQIIGTAESWMWLLSRRLTSAIHGKNDDDASLSCVEQHVRRRGFTWPTRVLVSGTRLGTRRRAQNRDQQRALIASELEPSGHSLALSRRMTRMQASATKPEHTRRPAKRSSTTGSSRG